MVLFKRKPVNYPESPPLPENTNTRCWYIAVTKEWFTDYNEYLKRMDYYKTRKFVCEITGNSCLTYFEAYESEVKEMKMVEQNFPEHLKEPILRHIQFITIPRIDLLVDEVYLAFRRNYFPGETVVVRLNDYRNDFKTRCIIREKAKFNAIYDNMGNVFRPAYSQYRVSRIDDNSELVVDESQITRDRNNFTKWFVKAFIKLCVTRSAKIGAPWIVKKKYAERYRIPMELPAHLAHFKEETKLATAKRPRKLRAKDEDSGDATMPDTKKAKSNNLRKIVSAPPKGSNAATPQPQTPAPAAPPVPKRIVQEDLLNSFEITTKKPTPHALEELGDFVSDALESWSFLNVYRVPLVLDTFTFDDFLTAMKWDSYQRCQLQDEIFCAVLSGFCKVGGTQLDFEIPEEYDSDTEATHRNGSDEKEDEDEDEDGKTKPNGSVKKEENGSHENGVVADKEEEEEEEDEEEDKENGDSSVNDSFYDAETNKVDQYLNYRGQSYIDRLAKRAFKDGGWQIIMLGIMEEVSHFKGWKDDIKEIFDLLAPLDAGCNNNSLLTHFQDLDPSLKVRALNILCSLLVNSPLIRQYLEKCMDQSTTLRRERLEKLRDHKAAYENAQNADKELRVLMDVAKAGGESSNQAVNTEEETKKKRRRGSLRVEPTEKELEFAKENEKFAELLATRTAQLKIAEENRSQRRQLEKEIVELDVQRIRYLGKDRLFNRYWWFENNGLPNLGGGKGSHDDEDEDADVDDEDDDDEPLQDETFLMGRLWVQGPSEGDLKNGLKMKEEMLVKWRLLSNDTDEDIAKEEDESTGDDDVKKEESGDKTTDENLTQDEIKPPPAERLPEKFIKAAQEVFSLKFDQEDTKIKSYPDGRTLVDEYGATVDGLTPEQRKIIEEHPDPLFTAVDWRYYDKVEEITKLMNWLNQWGKRESKLIKELTAVKDKITASIEARRKALKLDTKTPEELELIEIINGTVISDTEPESEEDENEESEDDDEAEENSSDSSSVEVELIDTPRTRRSKAQAEQIAEEKRLREEQYREKMAEKEARRLKSRPAARIARRQEKKRKAKEHKRKRQLLETSREKLENIREEMVMEHCLDWVNSSAMETLGYYHYDGPKKTRGRPIKGK